jgi:Uracil-DNA glycosylase
MIVGEAWGEQEEQSGQPFVGYSGQLLNSMLHEAGIMRSECYVTNVVNARPPMNDLTKWMPTKKSDITSKHIDVRGRKALPIVAEGLESLETELAIVNPDLVIALGNTALWAMTGQWGVQKWRGSQMYGNGDRKVIPAIHPAAILREWSWRAITVNDFRRARRHVYPGPYNNIPAWNFIVRPSLETTIKTLSTLYAMCEEGGAPLRLEFDLETSPIHITCAGISWSRTEAICIPFCYKDGSHYWTTPQEEGRVVYWLYKLLTHPNCWVRGQNLLYDVQHTYRWWHFIPNVKQDTMLSHHSMFSGMKKSLDFQASMYCDYYEYWKEMHKDLSNKAGA